LQGRVEVARAGDAVVDEGVIIEDMEIESGTVMVRPGASRGGATVIWHFDDSNGSKGGAG